MIPLGIGSVIAAPLAVGTVVSLISPYFILDNPDFWYGYMGYTGTVALAGAALWQNQSFRLESKRKEEYAIRPYLFTEIDYCRVEYLADHDIEFIQTTLSEKGMISNIHISRNKPKEVKDYISARQRHNDFLAYPTSTNGLDQLRRRTDFLTSEIACLNEINKKYALISYCLKNHGAGGAVKIRMLLNDNQFLPLFCLSHDEKKRLYFLVDKTLLEERTAAEFNIGIEFYNVEDFGPYRQVETFSICNSTTGEAAFILNKQISSPVLKHEVTMDDSSQQ